MVSKILAEEIEELKVSALPTRPTAPTSFGGKGYTATEMKAAFDRLPLFIIEKYNELIDSLFGLGEESITSKIPTGISEGHTLSDLLTDIRNGNFSSYLDVYGSTLVERMEEFIGSADELRQLSERVIKEIKAVKRDMGEDYEAKEFVVLDCGTPIQRTEGMPDAE